MTQLPTFTMRQLLEAGVHFGHHTRRWNPAMQPYLYGVRNGVHIIDLQQAVPQLYRGLEMVRDTVARGGRVLFVGTKRQAQEYVADGAQRSGQYFINYRWMGGMLTNWRTISQSIKRLRNLEEQLENPDLGVTKKERLHMERQRDKLEQTLGGIKDMGGLPDLIVLIDTNREQLAVKEATKLGIPTVAVCDSNTDPRRVSLPIPGNDDSLRAIELYMDLFARAVLLGLQAEMQASGADTGASDKPDSELEAQAIAEEQAEDAAQAQPAAAHG